MFIFCSYTRHFSFMVPGTKVMKVLTVLCTFYTFMGAGTRMPK